jgi:hypothetical protein
MEQLKPSIRWDNVVRKRPDGSDFIIQPRALTDSDMAMLAALNPRRHRFLNANYLAPLAGIDEEYARKRLCKLAGKGNNYVKLADWQTENRRLFQTMPNFYELDEAGKRVLEEEGYAVAPLRESLQYVHQAMEDQVGASIEIGTLNNPKLKLGTLTDIISNPDAPKHLKKKGIDPAIMVVRIDGKDHRVRKDWFPFYVEREDGTYIFSPGIETDTASQPIKRRDLESSSVYKHFAEDIAILEQEVYRTHFGARNCFFPYIFTTHARYLSAMDVLAELTKHKPSLRKAFGFKKHPKITMREKPRHTGHMITEDWERVGYPPFNFLTTNA